tara:strand:+ start:54 stop:230 length:177 start_codon:yes stop_codon:yes gene_type:complete
MTKKPDGVELALFHALRYELANFRNAKAKMRWDLDESETKAVEKWMVNRMKEIEKRLP